jgi:hypothetical protein
MARPGKVTNSSLITHPIILIIKTPEPLAKPPFAGIGHSERNEESRIFNDLRSSTSFRMTIKTGFAIASKTLTPVPPRPCSVSNFY